MEKKLEKIKTNFINLIFNNKCYFHLHICMIILGT